MQCDNQAVLNAVGGSQDQDQRRGQARPAIGVGTEYSLACWSGNRHATSDADWVCDGWVDPMTSIAQECRCVCHESVPRAPCVQALPECSGEAE
uniref:hypothetical protein n=1 Tax=Amycolatopsis sp. CA-096443 TaxID=3239919 RepID=UPI003F498FBC